MKCTKYKENIVFDFADTTFGNVEKQSEICKENAILVRTKNGSFIDLENFETFIEY